MRSTASRSVPPIGPTPCHLLNTRSVGSGPNSGSSAPPGVPGAMSTSPRPMAKIFALWLEPRPSGRRCTRQCTTCTPAARAAGNSRTMLGSATRRASSASAASPAFGPMTAPWHSWVTIAVCPGAASSASWGLMPDRRNVVELCRPFPKCHIAFRVDLGECRMLHVLLVAPDLQIVEDGGQELLFDELAQLAVRHVGVITGDSRPPDRVEQVRDSRRRPACR